METLEEIKKSKSSEKNEKKQTISKSVGLIEAELRKIKSTKKDLSEAMAKMREGSK